MELQQINQHLEQIVQTANKVNADFALTKGEYEAVKRQEKTMKAMYELKHTKPKLTQTAIEREALNDGDYKEYLDGLSLKHIEFLKAEANKNALDTKLSALQTLSRNYISDHNITNLTTYEK